MFMFALDRLNGVVGKLAVAAAALWLVIGQPASAATITATYAGTVETSFDSAGVFGTPGADLAGADYSLVFTIDDTVGSYSTFNGIISDPLISGDQILSGVTAALTINGHSLAFTGSNPAGNYDIVAGKPGFGAIVHQAESPAGVITAGLQTTNPGLEFPTSVYTAVALSSCPTGSCVAGISFSLSSGFFGRLNFGSLTVAATPIPAALPLLISALGGLGFVGWRRRNLQAA
jgi:hypothetical protein